MNLSVQSWLRNLGFTKQKKMRLEQALKTGGNIWKGLHDFFPSLPVITI